MCVYVLCAGEMCHVYIDMMTYWLFLLVLLLLMPQGGRCCSCYGCFYYASQTCMYILQTHQWVPLLGSTVAHISSSTFAERLSFLYRGMVPGRRVSRHIARAASHWGQAWGGTSDVRSDSSLETQD